MWPNALLIRQNFIIYKKWVLHSLTATHDKLTNKSVALDVAVIREQQAKI
jgi:hypothetical protein